jgi:hypothetical protein
MVEWIQYPRPPYRNYQVSSDGEIRRNGRELKGYVDRYGYRTVLLSYGGLSKRFAVHRLICEAFHGPCPEGLECAHIDGDKGNNRPDNLRWATRSENIRDQIAHGTFAGQQNLITGANFGETHNSAKLTEAQVRDLRARAAGGASGRSLAKEFGIQSAQASAIIRGDAWAGTACAQGEAA